MDHHVVYQCTSTIAFVAAFLKFYANIVFGRFADDFIVGPLLLGYRLFEYRFTVETELQLLEKRATVFVPMAEVKADFIKTTGF